MDPNGETTTAVFPLGTTEVTLTVKDGSLAPADTDVVKVTIQDTTPPVLTPPAAITIFTCASPNIGTATAVDTCGGGVTITNNAPAIFTLGENIVTWSAADIFGNTRTATQNVLAILGDDPSCCPAGTTVILGTAGDNDLLGTFGNDCILGLAGIDTLNGKGGNDFLSGGEGKDTLVSDKGTDYLASGPGRDNLNAGKGMDICIVDRTDNVVNCEKLIYYP
jgi:Ca2+-binding RTX toxin-like protein